MLLQIVDKFTKTDLAENLTIPADDSLRVIKEKLFAFSANPGLYPHFLKFELDGKVILNNDIQPIIWSRAHPIVLVVSNITNVVSEVYNPGEILNALGTDHFQKILLQLQKDGFIDLGPEDLETAVKLVMSQSGMPHLFGDIQSNIEEIGGSMMELNKKYAEEYKDLALYYKRVRELDPSGFVVDDSVVVNSLQLQIKGKSYSSSVRDRFIRLPELFDLVELTKFIPFAAISVEQRENPKMKVHNKLLETFNESEIASWILNRHLKTDSLTYKRFRGLIFKLVDGELLITVVINENGLMNIRCDTKKEMEHSLESLYNQITDAVDRFIVYINSYNVVFRKSRRIESVSDSKISIKSVSASVNISMLINQEQFVRVLANPSVRNTILADKSSLADNMMGMYYKKGSGSGDDTLGMTVNLYSSQYIPGESVVSVYNSPNVNGIYGVAQQIVILASLIENVNIMFNDT